MARNARPSLSFIFFLTLMGLLIAVGLFMLIYGSQHHVPLAPHLPLDGLVARGIPHA